LIILKKRQLILPRDGSNFAEELASYHVKLQWGKISLTVITLLALQNSVEWKARQLSCILPFIWPSDFEVPLFVITAHFPAGESEL
jgi:hypothetical protein